MVRDLSTKPMWAIACHSHLCCGLGVCTSALKIPQAQLLNSILYSTKFGIFNKRLQLLRLQPNRLTTFLSFQVEKLTNDSSQQLLSPKRYRNFRHHKL